MNVRDIEDVCKMCEADVGVIKEMEVFMLNIMNNDELEYKEYSSILVMLT